jgi:hypothetical protein
MFHETFIVQLHDLCPLSMYVFVHVCTILTVGRDINLYRQGFPQSKHMFFGMAIFPYMNIQDLAKRLLTSTLQSIPVVANPFLFIICILIVMEYRVLQHVRQSRFGFEWIRNLFMSWWHVWQFFLWSYSLVTNFLIL